MYDGKKDKNKDYSLGLHGAAMNGNVGLVKFALDHGAAIDSVVNGYMPLQLACINENHIAVVQYLIDRGADVNAQKWSKKHSVDKSQAVAGATGSTALHVACANGCTKIVDLLLRNGAKTNVRDKYGSRPVDVAAAKNHIEIVRLLETFESMEMMLQGLKEGKDHVENKERASRRSMDTNSQQQNRQQQQQQQQQQQVTSKSSKKDRLRRPSLPCVIEAQQQGLDIPDIATLPPPRRSFNVSIRPSAEELLLAHYPVNAAATASKNYNLPPSPPLEMASSKSSDDSSTLPHCSSPTGKEDWYSHGVIKQFDDANYLISLERRAYGLTSPIYSTITAGSNTQASLKQSVTISSSSTGCTSVDDGAVTTDETEDSCDGMRRTAMIRARTSMDTYRYSSTSHNSSGTNNVESASLKRCNSDGSQLRATALINNAIAVNQQIPSSCTSPTYPRTSMDDQQSIRKNNAHGMDDESGIKMSRLSISDNIGGGTHDSTNNNNNNNNNRPDLQLLRKPTNTTYKVKRSWWPTGTRKSIDLYPAGRPSLESNPRRTSLDFRPSLDSISHFAKKSMEGLSRKSTDIMDFTAEDRKRIMANSSNSSNITSSGNRGFLGRWWSSNTNASSSSANINATTHRH